MDGSPFYKRPWFYIVGWLAFWLGIYGWQIYRMGGIQLNLLNIVFDMVILSLLLVLWMGFFSQFVLPVQTLEDRGNIFSRLISRLFGVSGPAIFIRNGQQVKQEGEEDRKGPGVLWLDSASALVTRTQTKIKNTFGPGIHFTDGKEFIAGIVDLHVQSHGASIRENDKPFDPKSDEQTDEEYFQMQDRRKQVRALTRDGIEVLPGVSVSFRIDTGFPQEGQPGSRFGYRTGFTPKDKQNEKEDKEAIRKAILGEGINPNVSPESPRHRVAWNQLPLQLAIDVWREYAAKFTLDELFTECREIVLVPPTPAKPTPPEVDELSQPMQLSAGETFQNGLARVLRQVNLMLHYATLRLEGKPTTNSVAQTPVTVAPPPPPERKPRTQMKTGLQIINDMVKARLTQPTVEFLDDLGSTVDGHPPIESREYKLLQERGLKVLGAGVSNLRLPPTIEQQRMDEWEAGWLSNANAERSQIQYRLGLIDTAGQEQAQHQYADLLSDAIVKDNPKNIKDALKALLLKTRNTIVRTDPLRQQIKIEEMDEILRWLETNGS